ncbi:MAG: relaxase/mobilization nuclease domain-containing protein [Gammaproteobacteria bacterium]|nr:relaxase/mobilization nuclease [Rhodocyclaceae bacterium]MBU3908736.1 relaxase/mobilization nuclease domain-containing protein [Gammaproteobacteria bacterium]MBU3988858.1 relaxase/mobilization nuclease domain-containing protein [Gammaproteobacteria bacterium]MBU4004764.1 relaxase/mobilization nuclease domain-containing protein [Gammaproteobacteria bacterium]MBU4021367.1 relaxase/mobilization nuclease domain-containing protein [Gammaproteobacteria bacterium]
MIAKVPAKRNDGNSSFSTLGKYLVSEKLDKETGEIVRDARDVHVETNCLSVNTAAAEMRAVAEMNGRVNDPVYHAVISWREGEQPNDKQMMDAARQAQAAIGMDGHQFVYAIHRETDNHHVHMMVNRVHPDTHKAVYPDRDFYKLDKCMREVELAQGWQHDRGPYAVVDGKIERTKREAVAPPLPTKARDLEAATGCQSLLSYSQAASPELVAAVDAGDWQALHASLRKHGLEIREAGQGFKIYDIADPSATPVKASDVAPALGGGKLKKRLGEFQKPLRIVLAEKPVRTYNPYREKQQDGRDERREARAAARLALRQQFDTEKRQQLVHHKEQREAEKFALSDLAMRTRAERERIKLQGLPAEDRRARLSVLAMTAAAERERIKRTGVDQREAEKVKGYRSWCGDRATQGNPAAIAQLKGWEYQESRRRRAGEREEEAAAARGAIRAEVLAHDTPAKPLVLDEVAWSVDRRTGDVTYRLRGVDALRDTGRQVSVLQPTDDLSIEAGLRLAAQKFGSTLTLTGSTEFQQRAVRVAVEQGLGVRFADPAIEAYRLQIQQQRDGQRNQKEIGNAKRSEWDHRQIQNRDGRSNGREGR